MPMPWPISLQRTSHSFLYPQAKAGGKCFAASAVVFPGLISSTMALTRSSTFLYQSFSFWFGSLPTMSVLQDLHGPAIMTIFSRIEVCCYCSSLISFLCPTTLPRFLQGWLHSLLIPPAPGSRVDLCHRCCRMGSRFLPLDGPDPPIHAKILARKDHEPRYRNKSGEN